MGNHRERLGNRNVEFGNGCRHMNRFVVGVQKGGSSTLTSVLQRGRGRVVSVSSVAQEDNAYGTHSNKTAEGTAIDSGSSECDGRG